LGLLARLFGLAALLVAFRFFWDASGVVVPALSMAGVYLAWLFSDVGRLYWRAGERGKEHG
jgi:hypothetical protein